MDAAPSLDPLIAARAEDAELAALIGRAADADHSALAALYDRTCRQVHGLVLRILRDEASAEEITLDVYMQAYRQASSYDPARGRPVAWLLNLARSRAIARKPGLIGCPTPRSARGNALHPLTSPGVRTTVEALLPAPEPSTR